MKKTRNSKRIGVKSIHYNNNNIYIQDSFSEDVKLLYDVEYSDIEKLESAKSVTKVDDLKNIANFKDLKDKKGFELSKKISNKKLKSRITSVKNESYLQTVKDITTENNIEIQIYNLYEDIKKLLAAHCNDVVYKIASLMQQKLKKNSINSRNFDFLGIIISERDYDESKKKFDKKTNNGPGSFDTRMQKLVEVFRDLKILEKDEKNNSITEQDKRDAYNYIAILALIRNFSMHDIELKNRLKPLFNKAKKELSEFKNDFVKTNKKYFYILKDGCNNKEEFEKTSQDFFEYMTFDEKKNLGLSIEKIAKIVISDLDYKIDKQLLSEFNNKFKTMLLFEMYRYYKNNQKLMESRIAELKKCENKECKDELYFNYAKDYLKNNTNTINNIEKKVKRYLGKQKINTLSVKIVFNVDKYLESQFINCIYVFSIFLNKKDANSMYSDLINKINNIRELLVIANKAGVNVNETIIASHNSAIPLSSDFEMIIEQLRLFKNLRLKNITSINKEQKTNIKTNTLKYIFNCFRPGKYTFDDFMNDMQKDEKGKTVIDKKNRSKKPLKNVFRNNVYDSKYYQYLSTHSKTSICRKIMQNEEIVKFVLCDILGIKNNKENDNVKLIIDKNHEGMHKFLSKAYHDYKKDKINEKAPAYLLTTMTQVNELKNVLCSLNLSRLVDSIFSPETNYNYLSILKLYFMVCYLVVRGVMRINSSYFIAIQDYENIYQSIVPQDESDEKVKFDFSVIDHYIEYVSNKESRSNNQDEESKSNNRDERSRSYKQLITLLEMPYIKEFRKKEEYMELLKVYRNTVAHCTLLCDDKIWDVEFKNIKSYFGIYQTLMQSNTSIKEQCEKVWGDLDEYFKLDDDKSYSTKLTIAMNIIFAYNMSRFNNNTIEKYAMKKND